MFPEEDFISHIVSDTLWVVFGRRLVDRVLRLWTNLANGEEFPRRDQIDASVLGQDWANCLLIAVQSPVQFSYFVAVGENLSFAYSPDASLAGVLLLHLPQVISERRCLIIQGRHGASRLRCTISGWSVSAFPGRRCHRRTGLGAVNHRLLRE